MNLSSLFQLNLVQVMESIKELMVNQEDIQLSLTGIQDRQSAGDNSMAAVENVICRHEGQFSKILPILTNIKGSSDTSIHQKIDSLSQKVRDLMAMQPIPESPVWNMLYPSKSLTQIQALEEAVKSLQAQVQTLQMQIVGNRLQIGGVVFQNFSDVQTWVTAKFPIKCYGLFVDAVSLLDFFSFVSHTDTEKSVSAFYDQQKSGFSSMYKAQVASSTQNLFPMVFGRTNAMGMDNLKYLPAIQDPDQWDNGIIGLRYQICHSMGDVEFQLESAIGSILGDYPKPHQIA